MLDRHADDTLECLVRAVDHNDVVAPVELVVCLARARDDATNDVSWQFRTRRNSDVKDLAKGHDFPSARAGLALREFDRRHPFQDQGWSCWLFEDFDAEIVRIGDCFLWPCGQECEMQGSETLQDAARDGTSRRSRKAEVHQDVVNGL